MRNKIFLVFALVIGFMCPAIADTGCDKGYHVGGLGMVDKTPVIPVGDYTLPGDGWAILGSGGTSSNNNLADAGLTEPNTWAAHYEAGSVYGQASCHPISADNSEVEAMGYFETNSELLLTGEMTYEDFESGLAEIAGEAKASYVTDILRNMVSGMENGTMDDNQMMMEYYKIMYILALEFDANYSTTDIGSYCSCQVTGFTPTGGSYGAVDGAPWLGVDMGSAEDCMANCSSMCLEFHIYDEPDLPIYALLRSLAFGSVRFGSTNGMCDANDIEIEWRDAAQEDIDATNAGMCKYNGDIRTPLKALPKEGKIFKGWKFIKA